MDTNITKTWTIEISESEVFSRCVNESLYQTSNRGFENGSKDMAAISDDDKAQFHMYFTSAIASLNTILARRMDEPFRYGSDCTDVVFTLQMHDNHDDNILPTLIIHCYDYVVKKVLELWFHTNFGSELERFDINHCIHYRKNPVRRRVSPLI